MPRHDLLGNERANAEERLEGLLDEDGVEEVLGEDERLREWLDLVNCVEYEACTIVKVFAAQGCF
jgi:hypothetical protein